MERLLIFVVVQELCNLASIGSVKNSFEKNLKMLLRKMSLVLSRKKRTDKKAPQDFSVRSLWCILYPMSSFDLVFIATERRR